MRAEGKEFFGGVKPISLAAGCWLLAAGCASIEKPATLQTA